MTEVAAVDWLSQEFLADPYSHYKALRESDPVHWDETRGSWLLTRYQDIAAALRDDDNFSAEQGPAFSMLVTDPPRPHPIALTDEQGIHGANRAAAERPRPRDRR